MKKISKIVKKHQDGTTIDLFVTSGSQSIIFPAGYNKWRGSVEIKVSSQAKDNKANKEVIKTVANFVNKPVENVYVVSGSKNRSKTILIKGISPEAVSDKLEESLNGL
jgi:uncharacterized protein (TIGR00251 family)